MISAVSKVLSFTPFKGLGYYGLVDLRQCIFKAMSTNLALSCPLPKEPSTRAVMIGRFHHQLMLHASRCISRSELESLVELEIVEFQKAVDRDMSGQRLGAVSGWGEINRSARVALKWFDDQKRGRRKGDSFAELELHSKSTAFTGRPDYFSVGPVRADLIEFKASSLTNDRGAVKTEYDQQLAFYAALLFENYEISEVTGSLRSLAGEIVNRAISREEALAFLDAAAKDFESANDTIKKASDFRQLATPGADACAHCRKKIICPEYQRMQYHLGLDGSHYVIVGRVESLRMLNGDMSVLGMCDSVSNVRREVEIPRARDETISIGETLTIGGLKLRGNILCVETATRVYR